MCQHVPTDSTDRLVCWRSCYQTLQLLTVRRWDPMEDLDRVQHKTNRARGMDALFVYPLQKKTSYGRCKKQVLLLRVLQTVLRDSLGKGQTLRTNCRLVLLNSTAPGIVLSPWIVLEFLSFSTNRFVKTSKLNSSLHSELKTAANAASSWWSVC